MRKNKVDIITLGCSKNLVDSEQLMRQFVANGYTVEHDPHKINGEIVVVNTCGFIGDAQEESINMILDLGEAKKKGKIGKLFVMGCLSERFLKDLENELPEVDRFYGKFNWKELLNDLGKSYYRELAADRVLTTPRHYAYLKISEGCSNRCTFCAIPYIRERLNLGMVVLPEMQQAIKAIYDCAARGQPANATTLSPLLEEKAYSQVMLAQAQNADTRLTRRDIDMLLDRLQTANPESAQVAGTTDDEFRQKFAALARKKVGERSPEE